MFLVLKSSIFFKVWMIKETHRCKIYISENTIRIIYESLVVYAV